MSDQTDRRQAVAAQRVECARIQAFLRKKGVATSNLRHATMYAEASAMIDEYVAALEATIPQEPSHGDR